MIAGRPVDQHPGYVMWLKETNVPLVSTYALTPKQAMKAYEALCAESGTLFDPTRVCTAEATVVVYAPYSLSERP